MASAKSLEEMLSQDVDESAVSALVGSLESQLGSTSNHIPSQEVNSGAVTSNHVNIATVVDGTLRSGADGQKAAASVVVAGTNPVTSTKSALGTSANSQIVAATPTSTIMVTLPGALPASGYINQVSATPALLNSASLAAGRSVNNSDIKIVYSPQPAASVAQYSTCSNVSSVNSSVVQGQRSAIKVTSVSNGNATAGVNLNVTRPGQPLVAVTSVAPVLTVSAGRPGTPQSTQSAAISAIQNLANIAAQQPPLVIPSSAQPMSQHQGTALAAASAQQVASKQLTVGRLTVREQLEQKQPDKVIIKPQIIIKDGSSPVPAVTPPSQMPDSGNAATSMPQTHSTGNVIQVSSSTPTVITVSKPVQSQQQHHQPGQPINVVTQVVSNPNLLSGVQIVNVNTARPGAPGVAGQKTLAPRVVLSNPVRIAAAPQVITARPGAPGVQVAGQNTFTLPGMVRGTLLVKTENGLQVVNVTPSLTQGSTAGSIPGTYRFQSVQGAPGYTGGQLSASQWKAPGTPGAVRTLAPQQMTVTLPVSVSSAQMKTAQQVQAPAAAPAPQEWRDVRRPRRPPSQHPPQIPGEHLFNKQPTPGTPHPVISTTVFQPNQGLNVVTSVGATALSTPSQTLGQPAVTVKVSGTPVTSSTVTQPLTIQTTSANNQAATTPSQMSPNTAKKKCKNFLSTLIRLASDQPEQVATNVKNLIQGLIDGIIQPEEFTTQLQKELNSSPQPCLVPFLKKSLPYLRHSLMLRELTIEGVRPPPLGAVTLPPTPTAIPQIQVLETKRKKDTLFISQARQPVPQAAAPQVRVMAPVSSGTLTARIAQGPSLQGVIPQPGLVTPRLPSTPGSQTKSLLVASTGATKVSLANASHPMSAGATAAVMASAVVATASAASSSVITTQPTKATLSSSRSASASASGSSKEKEKRSYSSLSRDDDDINDVAAMGGVNLVEESQRILAANAEIVGTQIRSCKDETFLFTGPLQKRINSIAQKYGLDEVPSDVVALISHATQERLKTLAEKLGVIAEHRLENIKNDSRYEVTQDVKSQMKFLEELDRLEKKRHEEQEREILMRAAKSRSKLEDPEQLKLKQKAKEMQRAEMEELRQREANATALLAIGPRKKLKTDSGSSSLTPFGLSSLSGQNSTPKPQVRQRVKRANLKDLLFLMEQERDTVRTRLLYKSYVK